MALFDSLYYAMYGFCRKIGQKHVQAKGCTVVFMPMIFLLGAYFIYITILYKWFPQIAGQHSRADGWNMGLTIIVMIVSFRVYGGFGGRGDRIIKEYAKSKNQKAWLWLGGIYSVLTVSCPVLMWLGWRAIL